MKSKNNNKTQKIITNEELEFAALKPKNTDNIAQSTSVINNLLNLNQGNNSSNKSN